MKESSVPVSVRAIRQPKAWLFLAILVCIPTIAVWVYKVWQHNSSLQAQTTRAIRAIYEGNTPFLIAHEPDASKQLGEVTEAKLRQVHDRLIKPYARGWTVEMEGVDGEVDGPSGFAYLGLRHSSGRQLQIATNLQATDAGPREPCLWHMLNLSWALRFGGSKTDSHEQVVRRRIRGIREDREFLQGIGIRGILNGEWTELRSWDEALKRLESSLVGGEVGN